MWDTCYWTLIIALFNVYVLLLWATYVCKNGGLHWCKQLSSKWVEFFCLLAMYWQVGEWSGQRGKCFCCQLLEVIWRSNFWRLISFQLASHQWFFVFFFFNVAQLAPIYLLGLGDWCDRVSSENIAHMDI
jgi:hypothetical protein